MITSYTGGRSMFRELLKEEPQRVIMPQMEKCEVCDKPVDQCTCCPE
jgi:hypothetical protein